MLEKSADEIAAEGLKALDTSAQNFWTRPGYETPSYPLQAGDAIRICYSETVKGAPNPSLGAAERFLRQEEIPFTKPAGAGVNHVILKLEGENYGSHKPGVAPTSAVKLYETLVAFSDKKRVVEVEPKRTYGKTRTSAEIADNIIWDVFGPWLERALPQFSRTPIRLLQASARANAMKDAALALGKEIGMSDEMTQGFAVKMQALSLQMSLQHDHSGPGM